MDQSIFRRNVINSQIVPEPDDRLRGDVVQGKVVYIETRPTIVKRVARDPLDPTKELWVRDPRTNEPLKKKIELVHEGFTERSYIHNDIGNGVVHKNYDFQPSEHDLNRVSLPPMSAAELQQSLQQALKRISDLEEEINSPELPTDQVDIVIEAAVENMSTVEETVATPKRRSKKTSGAN